MSQFAATPSGRAALALEGEVEQAGCAMACSFSSSDELYAAMIDARRASGAYGPRRHTRHVLAVGTGIAVLVAAILIAV